MCVLNFGLLCIREVPTQKTLDISDKEGFHIVGIKKYNKNVYSCISDAINIYYYILVNTKYKSLLLWTHIII